MYLSYYNHHGINSTLSIGDFAENALKETPNIVVDQVIENLKEVENIPTIITGFRSPKEIERFFDLYNGPYKIKVVFIEADANLRFNRSVHRSRFDFINSKKEFLFKDKQQLNMGLKKIKAQLQPDIILNNRDINTYINVFISKYNVSLLNNKNYSQKNNKERPTKLETAILLALISDQNELDNYLTTTQITHRINYYFEGLVTSKNNISRCFNQNFHPYYEIKIDKGKIKYRLSSTGQGRAKLLQNKKTGAVYIKHQLVESYRSDKGPRQRIVMNLGNIDLPVSEFRRLAFALEEKLSGQESLLLKDEKIAQAVSSAMRNYQFYKIRAKQQQSRTDFLTIDLEKVATTQCRSLGPEIVANNAWDTPCFLRFMREMSQSP